MHFIHFSDLHYSKSTAAQSSLLTIEPLIKSLKKIHETTPIDLIFFTGDLIDKGGESYNSIEESLLNFYHDVLNPICNTLKINESRFIICPGNHDVVRQMDGLIVERGCRSTFIDENVVQEYITDIKNGGAKDGSQRILPYKVFESEIYGPDDENHYLSHFESSFKFKIDGKLIGVVALNSAWRCFDNEDKGRLLIGEKQLIDSIEYLKECDFKVALSHHNTDDLIDFDKERIDGLLTVNFDTLYTGHVHSASNKYVHQPKGKLLTIVAPGTLAINIASDSKKYSNGFSSTNIDFANGSLLLTFYTYHYGDKEFTKNNYISPNGEWLIELPKNETLKKDIEKLNILKTIENEQLSKLDTTLLTYNTDTIAPKCLKEIFVLPKLLIKDDADKEKKEFITDISSLINSTNNYLFFGTKESGKTTLLNKILSETIENSNVSKIPVYIDYHNISNDIISNVRDYILLSKESTKEALKTQNFIILIDNLIVSNKFEDILKTKQIEKLMLDHPKIQIFASYHIQFEGQVPEYISFLDKLNFRSVTIQEFQSKQIRALTTKWFAGSILMDKPKKMETIINGFLALSLPRTPFTVSMFLWIIEKQQNFKPINNSTLIETFVEKLLNKHSLNEIYSEKFDFKNKIRLLAELAYKMLREDRENYSDTHANVVQFISQHLERKGFDYNVEIILNDIIDSGILIKEENNIRFRFACFFEYFLVMKMSYDKSFKNEVLSEDNYLKFSNEIDYFTGLNRDNADILKLSVSRLESVFQSFIDDVSNLEPAVDDFFKQRVSQINIREEEVANIIPDQKATENDYEEREDRQLNSQRPQNGIKKKNSVSMLESLGTNLILCLKILKNCEEVEEGNLKYNSYRKILNCSIYFAIFYKLYISQLVAHRLISDKEKDEQLQILQFLPANHVHLLNRFMGTSKLGPIILKKIIDDDSNSEISDFERFISVFLYAEVRGKEYFERLNNFIGKANKKYILDNAFVQMLNYYSFRSKDVDSDSKYLNMIADILIKAKGFKKEAKSNIISNYKNKKTEDIE